MVCEASFFGSMMRDRFVNLCHFARLMQFFRSRKCGVPEGSTQILR